jgi:hypothetical protein
VVTQELEVSPGAVPNGAGVFISDIHGPSLPAFGTTEPDQLNKKGPARPLAAETEPSVSREPKSRRTCSSGPKGRAPCHRCYVKRASGLLYFTAGVLSPELDLTSLAYLGRPVIASLEQGSLAQGYFNSYFLDRENKFPDDIFCCLLLKNYFVCPHLHIRQSP